jgi:hypothetical protein
VVGRILLGDDTGYGAIHTSANHAPACWSLEFDYTPLYAHTHMYSVPTCVKLCVSETFWHVTTASVCACGDANVWRLELNYELSE